MGTREDGEESIIRGVRVWNIEFVATLYGNSEVIVLGV